MIKLKKNLSDKPVISKLETLWEVEINHKYLLVEQEGVMES